jgi:DNA-binding NarL/FixJ family response regulator
MPVNQDDLRRLHAQGYTNFEIAQATGIPRGTVNRHIKQMGSRPTPRTARASGS